jgi:hypothetical protein
VAEGKTHRSGCTAELITNVLENTFSNVGIQRRVSFRSEGCWPFLLIAVTFPPELFAAQFLLPTAALSL